MYKKILLVVALAVPTGCNRRQEAPQLPPAAVTVSQPLQREVIEWDEYAGHLEAPQSVELRARVGGLIIEEPFKEGDIVQAGTVLFEIDPSPYQADLDAKKAAVQQAEAQVEVSKTTFERYAQAGRSVAPQDYDTARANLKVAEAQLAAAKAAVEASQLNVDWCKVVAPITGRVGRKEVTPGNLITGGTAQGTLLTTLNSADPIYLYIYPDEQSVLKYQRLIAARRLVSARLSAVPCFMQLADEATFPHEGYIDFVDNQVDLNTGTLRVHGTYPNPTFRLLPGYYARMRVPGSGRYTTLLIPDVAVGTDLHEKFVLVVGDDNKVSSRHVQIGALFGKLRSIEEGITPTDWVIVKGVQKVRPGAVVQPFREPIPPSTFELTAPGSSTTQELPTTRHLPPTTWRAVTRPTSSPTTTGAP
jgi:RND family efflux transporter MFP subunit